MMVDGSELEDEIARLRDLDLPRLRDADNECPARSTDAL